jgi:outer membrane protein TolC
MRDSRHCLWVLAIAMFSAWGTPVFGQTAAPAADVRRLSLDDAVELALGQNLSIRVDRVTPQIQDLAIAQARSGWVPNVTSTLTGNSQNSPATSALSGGQSKITDSQFSTQIGVSQTLRTGTTYSAIWNGGRSTSSNIFTNFDPLLSSNVAVSVTQPLLRNYKIDTLRQELEVTRKDREAADIQLRSTIVTTLRSVKTAYWDLVYQIENLGAQRQSLDLARRLLADNEKRVQIGTMAPLDIVEAQAEVARNEEAVIVAEADVRQAEDRLRALILDPSMPDFWNVALEPTDAMPFVAQSIDVEGAVTRALENRTDVQLSRNSLARNDVNIRYFRNQALPSVDAQASYRSNGVGGVVLSPLQSIPLGPVDRTVLSKRSYGSVLGDVFSNAFPTWTLGVTVSYPVGASSAETGLARARLQQSQAEIQLKSLELQVAAQVRETARQVQTNQKRVDSARSARALAERRLDAEERKFAAGIQISFFVFQAQRDLTQARTSEIRALSDYNKSLADFEAVQSAALR